MTMIYSKRLINPTPRPEIFNNLRINSIRHNKSSRGHPLVMYEYHPTRAGHVPLAADNVTPTQRRSGEYKKIITARNKTMEQSRFLHPERWGRKLFIWNATEEIFLNLNEDTKERLNQKKIA